MSDFFNAKSSSENLVDNTNNNIINNNTVVTLVPKSISDYPEIEGAIYDPLTIRLLKNLASSRDSEFTATTNYLYQSVITEPFKADVAQTLEQIGEQEMIHQMLLMNAIRDFGANPTYTNANNIPWSSRYTNYEKSIRRYLEDDILSEQDAIASYSQAARQVDNTSLANLLLAIAEDEMQHKKILESLLISLD